MYKFFLVVHAIIAAAMVGVILLQRSEGGGLAGGGSPAGLMSARGAADFLTRTTTVLATLFITLSIGLAALAIRQRAPGEIDTSLARTAPVTAPAVPTSGIPMAGSEQPATPVTAPQTAPDAVPLAAAPVPVVEKKAAEKAVVKKVETTTAPAQVKSVPAEAKPAPAKITPPPLVVAPAAPAATGNSAQ
jgi:preprotein translocase subunit SecG